jgi:long-chain acyl-CoA synthetase
LSNLSLNLVAAARIHPHRTALRCDDVVSTFAEFDAAAARVATFLDRAGIEPGDRVGILLPNIPAFAVVFYAIMRQGAIAVPMNPLPKKREVEFYLSNTGAKALFATPASTDTATNGAAAAGAQTWLLDDLTLAELTADLPEQATAVERDDSDTAVVLHTSSTTDKPKGAELTHGGLLGPVVTRLLARSRALTSHSSQTDSASARTAAFAKS